MKGRSQFRWLPAAVAGLALLAGSSRPAAAGFVFTQEIRGEGEAGKYQNMTMRAQLDSAGAKMEILSSGNPILSEGNYLLIQPEADAMLLVNPEERSYAKLDFGQMMGAVGQMFGGQQPQEAPKQYPDPVVEKLLEEDGGTILGHPTKHLRWRTQYTIGMSLPMGMSMEVATDQTEDVWVADIAIDPKILASFSKMGGGAQLPANFQKIVEAAKKTQRGFPLKRVLVTKSESKALGDGMMAKMMAKSAAKQNAAGPQTTIFEVKELAEQAIPASTFSVPAGYREVELFPAGLMPPGQGREH